MVPTKSGLLLEHLARLAANAAGTPMAVIGVRGRRSDARLTLAAFGLTAEQAAAMVAVDDLLAAEGSLTVVPDLTRAELFRATALLAEATPPRFLAHFKLLSAGRERIGFICVLDPAPRPGLSEAQAASLDDIASMILANRRREQRHLHFMHVANRALRVDRMLHLVSDAASCGEALTSVLEELCRYHGAAMGRIWQSVRAADPVREVSRYDAVIQSDATAESEDSLSPLHPATAEALRRNEPQTIRFSGGTPPDRGLTSQVCIPIWVQQQRFAIVLAFTQEPHDLDAVVADIASLADAIRPALFRKVTEERIRFVAHHDNLTQLPNRLMFQERLDRILAAARAAEQEFAVLYLDLDGFKLVNDTHGHEIGDKLLAAVAQRLRENMREADTVARMGGDEFAIIQPPGGQPYAAVALARRLLETLAEPFDVDGRRAFIGISIGIAIYPQDGESAELLLRHADIALYRAKEAGRNNFQMFAPSMRTRQQERFLIEQDLRDAIDGGQFSLVYQPVCDSMSLRILGLEALLRWQHPSRGAIPPSHFIPLAESTGLIMPLGRWALETACMEAATWDELTYVSVNLSPLQFRQPDLPEMVAEVLNRTGLPGERLELEVTEGLLLEESDLVLRTTRRLQQQGVRITLDDFGTAYASLSYLRRFPFDRIKIDKSFIRGLGDDDGTLAIVQAILSLGQRLNLTVVAEGVETRRELAVLRNLDCRLVQGHLSGKPASRHRVRNLLRRQREQQAASLPLGVLDGQHARERLGVASNAASPVPYDERAGGE